MSTSQQSQRQQFILSSTPGQASRALYILAGLTPNQRREWLNAGDRVVRENEQSGQLPHPSQRRPSARTQNRHRHQSPQPEQTVQETGSPSTEEKTTSTQPKIVLKSITPQTKAD